MFSLQVDAEMVVFISSRLGFDFAHVCVVLFCFALLFTCLFACLLACLFVNEFLF